MDRWMDSTEKHGYISDGGMRLDDESMDGWRHGPLDKWMEK